MNFGLFQPLLDRGAHTLRDLDGSLGAIMLNVASIVGLTAGGINILHAKVRLLAPGADFPFRRVYCGSGRYVSSQAPSVLELEPRKMGG